MWQALSMSIEIGTVFGDMAGEDILRLKGGGGRSAV